MPGTNNERFRTLIEPHLDVLYRAAFRLARNRADAEDLVQETCIRACLRINDLNPAQSVRSWLMRVMHNLFVDGTRRVRHSPIDRHQDHTEASLELACPDPTPEDSACSAQRAAQLERAWLRLDRGQRMLLALRAEGYTLAELSEITGIAMDALTMRLYRARQILTRRLKEEETPSSSIPMEATK